MARILILGVVLLGLAATASAQEERSERLYDVSSLGDSDASRLNTASEFDFKPLGIPDSHWSRTPVDRTDRGGPQVDQFIELALTALDPAEQELARLEAIGGSPYVSVRTTRSGHAAIAAVHRALQSARDRSVRIEVVSLALPARALDTATLESLDGTVVGREARKRLIALDLHGGRRRSTLEAEAATWNVLRETRSVGYLSEYDVEIAQAASIGDPIVPVAQDGVLAAIRPFPLRDGRHLLRVVASTGDLATPFRRLTLSTTDLGQVELPEYVGGLASFEMLAASGETRSVVLGSADSSDGPIWRVLLLTVESAEPGTGADTLQILDVGALSAADPRRRLRWFLEDAVAQPHLLLDCDTKEPEGRRMDAEALVMLVATAGLPDIEKEGAFIATAPRDRLMLRATRDCVERMTQALAGYESALLRQVNLRVRLVSLAPEGGPQTLGQLSAPIVTGGDVSLAAYREISFVQDYDVEVAQERRIADPIVRTARSGTFVNVRVDPGADGRLVVALDLRLAAVNAAPEPLDPGAADVGVLERLASSVRMRTMRLSLTSGEERAVALGPDPFDRTGKRTLHVLVRAEAE